MISLLAYWWYLLVWYDPSYMEVKSLFALFSVFEFVMEVIGLGILTWGWLYINEPWKEKNK